VDEPDNLFVPDFGDQQRATKRWIADESGPHATADIHCRIQLGGGKQLAIAHSPGLSVRLANALGVTRMGSTDHRHS
jgi:hypothetical protein